MPFFLLFVVGPKRLIVATAQGMSSALPTTDEGYGSDSVISDEDIGSPSKGGVQACKVAAVGVLPNGERFTVPETMSVLAALVKPRSWKSPVTLLWILVCCCTIASILLYVEDMVPRFFFCALFAFWRLGYNAGLGYLLRKQSNEQQFLRLYVKYIKPNPTYMKILETSVVFEDDSVEYKPSAFPDEFNAWMVYRFVVMFVLALDVVGYFLMVAVYWHAPDFTSLVDIARYVVGLGLIIFATWSKADAHRVIGDYAWYWGDFFFLLDKHLVFDGIFQMFPHPMYTVGYAFMYGFPLMAKSYTVFYMSLFGHVCQFLFLTFVENPHIDKTYNVIAEPTPEEKARDEMLYGEDKGYFSKDEMVIIKNFDPFRSTDLLLVVLLIYLGVIGFVLDVPVWFHVAHYVCWRLFHNGVLGWVLHQQSTKKQWTHKHYRTPREAFNNWKRIFNTSVLMTNLSYGVCAWKLFEWQNTLIVSFNARVLVFIIGLLLMGINVYVSTSAYEVVGDFGFFYGDFFIDDVPSTLNYSGIYRYLNNPDSTLGFSGYYGVALMSGNLAMLPLAIFSHACVKLFEVLVETPHMHRKYGRSVRRVGGLRSEMRKKGTVLKERLQKTKLEYELNVRRLREEMERKRAEFEVKQAQLRQKFSKKD